MAHTTVIVEVRGTVASMPYGGSAMDSPVSDVFHALFQTKWWLILEVPGLTRAAGGGESH